MAVRRLPFALLVVLFVAGSSTAMILADPPRKPESESSKKPLVPEKRATPNNTGAAKKAATAKKTVATSSKRTKGKANARQSEKSESLKTEVQAGAKNNSGSKVPGVSQAPIGRKRELAALKFAREHHRDLADLLKGLRKTDEQSYQTGLRSLTRDAERISKIADRDEERYQLAVEVWKADSRIRLEIARLSMSPDEDVESRLRPLLLQKRVARIDVLELERSRAFDRMNKCDEQLEMLKGNRDERIAQEIKRVIKQIANRLKKTKQKTLRPNQTLPTLVN